MGYTKEYVIDFIQFLFYMIGGYFLTIWITQRVQQHESFAETRHHLS